MISKKKYVSFFLSVIKVIYFRLFSLRFHSYSSTGPHTDVADLCMYTLYIRIMNICISFSLHLYLILRFLPSFHVFYLCIKEFIQQVVFHTSWMSEPSLSLISKFCKNFILNFAEWPLLIKKIKVLYIEKKILWTPILLEG